jgi:flavin-binding protein dodecin
MSMVKVIEVLAESEKSWEDAAQNAIKEAGTTLRNIKSLYVSDFQVAMVDGQAKYRLDAKICFVLDEDERGRKHGRATAQATR